MKFLKTSLYGILTGSDQNCILIFFQKLKMKGSRQLLFLYLKAIFISIEMFPDSKEDSHLPAQMCSLCVI